VEGTLRSHPEVTDAVVTARRNAFSGWILVASVVPAAASDRATLPARLRELCAATLRPECVPATVKVVDELSVSTTGKAVRR
jgi:acyl-coenzyme A synthetase/AMP-(fatty) acid ligase